MFSWLWNLLFRMFSQPKHSYFSSSQMLHCTSRRQDVVWEPVKSCSLMTCWCRFNHQRENCSRAFNLNRPATSTVNGHHSLPLLLAHTQLFWWCYFRRWVVGCFPGGHISVTLVSTQGKVSWGSTWNFGVLQKSAFLPACQTALLVVSCSKEASAESISKASFAEGLIIISFWQTPVFISFLFCVRMLIVTIAKLNV